VGADCLRVCVCVCVCTSVSRVLRVFRLVGVQVPLVGPLPPVLQTLVLVNAPASRTSLQRLPVFPTVRNLVIEPGDRLREYAWTDMHRFAPALTHLVHKGTLRQLRFPAALGSPVRLTLKTPGFADAPGVVEQVRVEQVRALLAAAGPRLSLTIHYPRGSLSQPVRDELYALGCKTTTRL
jgi:hypothetical protein